MTQLRALIREHRRWAIALLVLALCFKAAIPAGMMVSSGADRTLMVTICAETTGGMGQMAITVPAKPGGGASHQGQVDKGNHCAFTGLAKAALGGVDAVLLASAFAFILVLGMQPVRIARIARTPYLRPPLRGPPAAA